MASTAEAAKPENPEPITAISGDFPNVVTRLVCIVIKNFNQAVYRINADNTHSLCHFH